MTSRKELELPAEYRKHLASLLELTDTREYYARELKNAAPEVRRQAAPAMRELDKSIEKIESGLAKEYERLLAEHEREAALDESIAAASETVEEIYIEIRDHAPHLFERFQAVVTEDMSAEEREEFFDRIAVREAQMKRGSK
jgi:hypothetical protein